MIGWRESASLANDDRGPHGAGRGRPPALRPLLRAVDALDPLLRQTDASTPIWRLAGPINEAETRSLPRRAAVDARRPAPARRRSGSTPRKVDRMLDAVGETVLYHRRLEHALDGTVGEGPQASDELDMGERLLDDLQDSVIQMRTLPLSTITAPFRARPRPRDRARGRRWSWPISGAETQLDRVILDGISETIVHLLRNAVAHGIEPPEEREAARQAARRADRAARRTARRHGRDRGRRRRPRRLRRSSRARRRRPARWPSSSPRPDSRPPSRSPRWPAGASAWTRSSDSVESLGGALEVQSEPGSGTEVTLLLPVTLALMRVLLFERGEQPFALPMTSVGRVVWRSPRRPRSAIGPRSRLEGQVVPLSDLARRSAAAPAEARRAPAGDRRRIARAAPRPGLRRADRRGRGRDQEPRRGPRGRRGYLGAAILGDGRIALVLDPHHLLKASGRGDGSGSSRRDRRARAGHGCWSSTTSSRRASCSEASSRSAGYGSRSPATGARRCGGSPSCPTSTWC